MSSAKKVLAGCLMQMGQTSANSLLAFGLPPSVLKAFTNPKAARIKPGPPGIFGVDMW